MAILDALSRMHMAAYRSQTVNDTEVKLLGSLFSKAMENEDNPRASADSRIPHLFIFGIPICK